MVRMWSLSRNSLSRELINKMDFINQFKLTLQEFGLTPPSEIVADGKRHRFSSDGNSHEKNGWYILYSDNLPAGAFGCWKSGINEKWKSSEKKTYTPEQRAEYAQRIKDVEQERADAELHDRQAAAATSADMWARAGDVPADHPYITRKQIKPIGIKSLDGELLIPVMQGRDMVGLQRIPYEVGGVKKPVYGTPMQGSCFYIGLSKTSQTVIIAEGYATGVSVHMATGDAVVVAFNAGNLIHVAKKIREVMPSVKITIAADDDFKTMVAGAACNVGIEAAKAAAAAVGGTIKKPVFMGERGDKDTDFNDLHVLSGLDAVTQIFTDDLVEIELHRDTPRIEFDDRDYIDNYIEPEYDGLRPFVVSRHNIVAYYGLDATDKGVPFTSTANILRVVRADPNLHGRIWFDEFLGRIMTTWGNTPEREWAEIDDINLQVYLQESLGMPKLGKMTVSDAVTAAAYQDTRNEAKNYILGCVWDGKERVSNFLKDVYGVIDSDYHRGVSQIFWISLVARALNAGCQMRTMVVLEGLQNAGKSKSLAIIGGKWFAEANNSPTDKDFYLNLIGKILIEIGEMDAFNRSDVTKIKQVVSCQTDRYRAPYERRAADHHRTCIFGGTTNRDDWNKDETGGSRFLPVTCVSVNLEYLIENRDQFFAEAVHKYKTIPEYWNLVPLADAKREQEARRDHDTLEEDISNWIGSRTEITTSEIMTDLMELKLDKQDKGIQMRVAKCLRAMGWKSHCVWRGGKNVKAWKKIGSEEEVPF